MAIKTPPADIAFRKHDHRRCQRALRDQADRLCAAGGARLTRRRRQVLEILLASHQPLGAYDILAELNRKEAGQQIAPPIVYRALDFLVEVGLIHRIESRNAYVSCSYPGHDAAARFLICRDCEQVAELQGGDRQLLRDAGDLGFSVDHAVIEVTGVCAACGKHGR